MSAWRKAVATAVAVAALGACSGAAATAASASVIGPGNTPFVGHGSDALLWTDDGSVIICSNWTFTGSTTSPASGSISYRPAGSGCYLANSLGYAPAEVEVKTDWTTAVGDDATPTRGTTTMGAASSGHAISVYLPDYDCRMEIDAPVGPGIYDETWLSGHPGAAGLEASVYSTGPTYSQNGACPIPSTGVMTISGSMSFPGVSLQ